MNSNSDKNLDILTFLQTNLPEKKGELTPELLWWYNFILVQKNYKNLLLDDQEETIITGYYGEKVNLSSWLEFQNIRYHHHNLTEDQKNALEGLKHLKPMLKKTNETKLIVGWLNLIDTEEALMLLPIKKEHLNRYEIWPYNYLVLKKYYQEHGNVKIKYDDKIKGFYGEDVSLFGWVNSQRYRKKNKTLPPKQEELLTKLGVKLPLSKEEMLKKTSIKWLKALENNDIKSILPTTLDGLSIYDNWWYKYYFLWCYYKEHENISIHKDMTATGFYGEKIKLDNWLTTQKYKYRHKNLDTIQIEKLNALGIVWNINIESYKDTINAKWENAIKNNAVKSILPKEKQGLSYGEKWWYNFSLLKDYYQKHHNLTMYYQMKITGYYNEEVSLEHWYTTQKKNYQNGKLTPTYIAALESITKDWASFENIRREPNYDNTSNLMLEVTQKWVQAINTNTVKNILPEKKEALEFFEVWWYNFYLTKDHLEKNQNIILNDNKIIIGYYGEIFNIGTWLYHQRKRIYSNSLNEFQLKALKTINLVGAKIVNKTSASEKWLQALETNSIIDILPMQKFCMSDLDNWWYNYSLAYNYYQSHGNIDITTNGTVTGYYKETVNLGNWLYRLKKQVENSSLSTLQIAALRKIDFPLTNVYQSSKFAKTKERWLQALKDNTVTDILPPNKGNLPRQDIWWYNYWLAKKYYDTNGNLKFSKFQKVIGYYQEPVNLNAWLNGQKSRYKKADPLLIPEQIALLNAIEIKWINEMSSSEKWNLIYKEAAKYYDTYHNLLIPDDYNVTLENDTPYNLGDWIKRQRVNYQIGKLSKEKVALLEDIKMVWSLNKFTWETRFAAAKKYYNEHGNLIVETDYELDCPPGAFKLYDWLKRQREDYWQKKLTEEQINLLESINIDWTKLSMDWLRMFNYAKAYYLQNGNLYITGSYKFVNSNGNLITLGSWLKYQIRCYEKNELLPLQIELLNSIGIIWNNNTNRLDMIKLFEFYRIKGSKRADIVKHYSSLEINAKIQLCILYNMPFNINGDLNPIFTMSSKDLQEKYNVSLEELIKKYQNKLELVRR